MATGGEVPGQNPGSVGSEDLDQLKCQPCLEDGNLCEVVGMCVDCQEYLCSQCFKFHTLPKPTRNHQLLDKEQMLQSQIRTSPKDLCTEKCAMYKDKIIEYYCTTHCLLGCTVCITLNHAICKSVHYIPNEAMELTNNEEYRQVENQLKSALKAFETVIENVQRNGKKLGTTCKEALENMDAYRKKVEEEFDKIEAKLVEQAEAIKSKEIHELVVISDNYQKAHVELQTVLAKIEALQKFKQNCSLYTEMMRTKDKLKSMDAQIKEAEVHKACRESQIKFSPNKGLLDSLKNPESFGTLSGTGKEATGSRCKGTIVSAKHARDIRVNTGTDTSSSCWITGSVVLPDGRLVLADFSNSKIKAVSVQSGHVLSDLKLSSEPWDVAAITNNKLAVTLPFVKKLAIETVDDNNLSIDSELTVCGTCRGVDFRNDKLAVSFCNPQKVQVLNLQGSVLYTIPAGKQGNVIFNNPYYLTYGKDDITLYVSNYSSNNVVCLKLDGTVVATYSDSGIKGPVKLVVDNRGSVYVCARNSNLVHQISQDCKKIQVLLTQADGLNSPYSICLNEEADQLYVGMHDNAILKVYTTERRAQ